MLFGSSPASELLSGRLNKTVQINMPTKYIAPATRDKAVPDSTDDGYEILAALTNGQTTEFVIPHWVKLTKNIAGGSPSATSVVMRAYNL